MIQTRWKAHHLDNQFYSNPSMFPKITFIEPNDRRLNVRRQYMRIAVLISTTLNSQLLHS